MSNIYADKNQPSTAEKEETKLSTGLGLLYRYLETNKEQLCKEVSTGTSTEWRRSYTLSHLRTS